MDGPGMPVALLGAIVLLVVNLLCGRNRGQQTRYILSLPPDEEQRQGVSLKTYCIIMVVTYAILWVIVTSLRRRGIHRIHFRRRTIASSSSVTLGSHESDRWESAKNKLEQDLSPLAGDVCQHQPEKEKSGDHSNGETIRPFLPIELRDTCFRTVSEDKHRLCDLLINGKDDELAQYIGRNGLHPSNYGLNLPSAMAFFHQHSDMMRAMLNPTSAFLT